MKKVTEVFFKVCSILVAVLSLIIIFYAFKHVSYIAKTYESGPFYNVKTAILFSIAAICFAFGASFLMRKAKHQKRITLIIFGLIAIMMILSLYLLWNVRPTTDAYDDIDTAYYLLSHKTAGLSTYHSQNLGRYGNNYLFVFIVKVLMSIMQILHIHDLYHGLMIINFGLIYVSLIIDYVFMKEAFSIKTSNLFLLFAGFNPTFYLLGAFIYTVTFTMPIMAGLLLLILRFYRTDLFKKRVVYVIGIAIMTVFGYMLRPTAIFIVIAGLLMLPWIMKRISLKQFCTVSLVFFVVSGCLFVPLKKASDSLISESVRDKNYPVSYWFLIGSHYKAYTASLHTGVKDRKVMDSTPEKNQRNAYAKAKVIQNYKKKGPKKILRMWLGKMGLSFSEGTSSLTFRCRLGNIPSPVEKVLFGRYKYVYRLYCFAIHIAIFIGIIIVCLYSLFDQRKPSLIMQVTLLGGYVFYMLWEAKNIYHLPFVMIMIMLSVVGYETISENNPITSKYPALLMIPILPAFLIYTSVCSPIPEHEPILQSLSGRKIFKDQQEVTRQLSQTFVAEQDFTDVKIPVEAKRGSSSYKALMTKDGHKKAEKVFHSGHTIHIRGHFKKGKYKLTLKRLHPAKPSIKIMTKKSYLCDSYDGTLIVDGKRSVDDMSLSLSVRNH